MIEPRTIADCQGCGACCLHIRFPPFHSFAEERVPDWAVIEFEDERSRVGGNNDGPCLWFDLETRLCKHHDIRPEACRSFAIGDEACRLLSKYYNIGNSS